MFDYMCCLNGMVADSSKDRANGGRRRGTMMQHVMQMYRLLQIVLTIWQREKRGATYEI
jgi:hypothetical protein